MMPRVLIVAGSDSGGGAGIQADIKTVTQHSGYAMTAITALTAQNTQGVAGIEAVSPAFIASQMQAVLTDIGADIIKTGMLHNEAVMRVVHNTWQAFDAAIPLVLDPVMVATSGDALIDNAAIDYLKTSLIPKAFVITPNIPEAELLTHMTIRSQDDMKESASRLHDMGAKNVLLKGGHVDAQDGNIYDYLATPNGNTWFCSSKIDTKHTHGTGCTLASALATRIAAGDALQDAAKIARNYVHDAILCAPNLGKGHGPLGVPSA